MQWNVLNKTFFPEMNETAVNQLLSGWNRAIRASIAWANDKN